MGLVIEVAVDATDPASTDCAESRDLAASAARGDQAAFAAIYREHADRVFRLLTRLAGPHSERDDLLQETFVRLHGALPSYRGDAALSTFIHRIAVRVAYDYLRRQGRRPPATGPTHGEAVRDNAPSPRDRAEVDEQLERALGALELLKPSHRIAFVLREAMGYSFPEIAACCQCRPSTARMRVAAAKRTLARLMRSPRRLR